MVKCVRLHRVVGLALVLALLSACGGSNSGTKRDVRDLQAELAAAREQIDALNQEVDQLKNPVSAPQPGEPLTLTILHMNDHHSHLQPHSFNYPVNDLNLSIRHANEDPVSQVAVSYGGFPMLASLFRQLETQAINPVKIHAGDAITGTLYYALFQGTADAAMMNQICFDIFALGNHEFDDGDQGLANFLDDLRSGTCHTDVLAANVVPHADSPIREGYFKPYVVREFQGQKVGFIGIDIADKTANSSRPDPGTEFLDEIETAQRYIDELHEQGVNKIVLVTHYQYENDIAMAAQLSGVDVIVGGDSHSLLGGDTFRDLGFNAVDSYPTRVTNKDGDTVCVVQAWEYARIMGKLIVEFDGDGKVTHCGGQPYLPIASDMTYSFRDSAAATSGVVRRLNNADAFKVRQRLTQYPEVVAVVPDVTTENLLAVYAEEYTALTQMIIGSAAEDLCLVRLPGEARSTICDVSATSVNGSDISNIVAKAFMSMIPSADIAIQNGGGVRVDIPEGDISFAKAVEVLPFNNTLVTLEMTGAQIKAVLEDAMTNALRVGGSSGAYPYASGLRYHIDASQPEGMRVSNLEINPRVAGDWVALDPMAVYTVVTNDFIASGQDGYATFGALYTAGEYVNTYTLYTQSFIDYIRQLTEAGEMLRKLPLAEYSTQQYIGRDGCNHSTEVCEGY